MVAKGALQVGEVWFLNSLILPQGVTVPKVWKLRRRNKVLRFLFFPLFAVSWLFAWVLIWFDTRTRTRLNYKLRKNR